MNIPMLFTRQIKLDENDETFWNYAVCEWLQRNNLDLVVTELSSYDVPAPAHSNDVLSNKLLFPADAISRRDWSGFVRRERIS